MDLRLKRFCDRLGRTFLGLLGLNLIFLSIIYYTLKDETIVSRAKLDSSRVPASVSVIQLESRQSSSVEPVNQVLDIQLDCLNSQQMIKTQASRVRIYGSPCVTEQKLNTRESKIENRSNGLTATIFNVSQSSFSTDLQALKLGLNEFEVILRGSESSEFKSRLVVNRIPIE